MTVSVFCFLSCGFVLSLLTVNIGYVALFSCACFLPHVLHVEEMPCVDRFFSFRFPDAAELPVCADKWRKKLLLILLILLEGAV